MKDSIIKTNATLSVIIPIYKTDETYLRDAVESVLQQTFADFEFIIVNDCPEDEERLRSIIESYADSRIVWLSSPINSGIACASNLGIEYAKGKYIAMMDHDDICMNNRFAQQIEFLENNPQIGFIGGQAQGLYADGTLVDLNYPISNSRTELIQSFFDGVPFLNPSVMFRRTALNQLRYNPAYKVCADYDLFARLIIGDKLIATNLPDILIHYRLHDANTSLNQYLLAEEETNKVQAWISQQIILDK